MLFYCIYFSIFVCVGIHGRQLRIFGFLLRRIFIHSFVLTVRGLDCVIILFARCTCFGL